MAYSGYNIWWRNVTKKKLSANLYGSRIIRFVGVFSVWFSNDYVQGNQPKLGSAFLRDTAFLSIATLGLVTSRFL